MKRATLIPGYLHPYLQAGNVPYVILKFYLFIFFNILHRITIIILHSRKQFCKKNV